MVNPDAVRNVVGIIGNFISFGLFLSPLPTFLTIVKKKDVEEFVPDPYLATFLNCALWVFYGLPFVHPNSILVVTINGTGLAIEIIYLSIYFAYAPKPKRLRMLGVLAVELAFLVAVAFGVLLGAHTYDKRSLIVGSLCVFFGTLMYASPLTVMKQVITTKSVEYMPFTLSLVSFINGICWTTYALIRFDIFITITESPRSSRATNLSSNSSNQGDEIENSRYLAGGCDIFGSVFAGEAGAEEARGHDDSRWRRSPWEEPEPDETAVEKPSRGRALGSSPETRLQQRPPAREASRSEHHHLLS